MSIQKKRSRPATALEKEAAMSDMEESLQAAVDKLSGAEPPQRQDHFHNTKKLLRQYRRVAYAIQMSESELNLRMELEHGMHLSTFKVNAELAGIDLSNTKVESYTRSLVRSKTMLEIINHALESVRLDPDYGDKMYHVLRETYFTPHKPKNRDEIIRALEQAGYPMSSTTYHVWLRNSITALDRILWGYTARDCAEIVRDFLSD